MVLSLPTHQKFAILPEVSQVNKLNENKIKGT